MHCSNWLNDGAMDGGSPISAATREFPGPLCPRMVGSVSDTALYFAE